MTEPEQWMDPETGDCDYCDHTNVAVRPDDQGMLACRRCAAPSDGQSGGDDER